MAGGITPKPAAGAGIPPSARRDRAPASTRRWPRRARRRARAPPASRRTCARPCRQRRPELAVAHPFPQHGERPARRREKIARSAAIGRELPQISRRRRRSWRRRQRRQAPHGGPAPPIPAQPARSRAQHAALVTQPDHADPEQVAIHDSACSDCCAVDHRVAEAARIGDDLGRDRDDDRDAGTRRARRP